MADRLLFALGFGMIIWAGDLPAQGMDLGDQFGKSVTLEQMNRRKPVDVAAKLKLLAFAENLRE